MKKQWITYYSPFVWGLFGILIILIGYFGVISNQIGYDHQTQILLSIDKLKELEVSINEHVLQSRNHMNVSDSVLSDYYLSFRENEVFLLDEIQFLKKEEDKVYVKELTDSLILLLNKKQNLIQIFQQENDSLHNALLAMSLESIALYDKIPQENLQEDVNSLINQVFIYHVRNELMFKDRVEFYQEELKMYKHEIRNEKARKQVELLLQDSQIVLDKKPKVNQHLTEIIDISFGQTINNLSLVYNQNYQRKIQRKNQIKAILYVLCVFLVFLVIYLVFRSFSATKKLRELNDSLESQVKERTSLIKEREKLLNEFLTLLPFGIYVVDKHQEPVYINKICKEFFPKISDYSNTETNFYFGNLYSIETGKAYEDFSQHPVSTALEGTTKIIKEFLLKTEFKQDRYISMLSTPVFEDDQSLRYVIIAFEDITERKNKEKELIEARKTAELATVAKEEFLAVMSHELRTPLNAVVGITHLLLDRNPLPIQLENLNTLKFSAEYLMRIINDILDHSKIEAGKIEFEETIINIPDMLANIYDVFSYQATKNNTDFVFKQEENVPELIKGDSLRLVQIVNNLVSNAIKFTHNGTVDLSVKIIGQTLKKVTLLFEVKDTGVGIPSTKLETIFQSFSQGSSKTTRKFGGTGLGLTITKRLVELQGGELWVKSEEGIGSTFSFRLTFLKARKESETPKKISYIPLNLDVLLVEDSPVNQLVATQFLKQWGNKVQCAKDGIEALSILKEESFDVILMDIHMPNMDGLEATKKIRAQKNNTPIIALTATVSEIKDKVSEVGMNAVVHKPFNPHELYQTIKENVELKQK